MANRSKEKGDRMERDIVHKFLEAGIHAQRVPLSGAAGGEFSEDIVVHLEDGFRGTSGARKFECKSRAKGFAQLYGWLFPAGKFVHALVIKRDRSEPLVVMRLSDYINEHRGEW